MPAPIYHGFRLEPGLAIKVGTIAGDHRYQDGLVWLIIL
jgi:hypothetical protein